MKNWYKILFFTALSFISVFLCVGFAAISDRTDLGIASVFALKTEINCFLNERHRPRRKKTHEWTQS